MAELLKEYATTLGFAITQEYVDVETAKHTGRTAFWEMVSYLRANASIRVLLVEKTDRLYRNLKDWVTVDELEVEIHFAKEAVVLSRESRSSEKFMHGIKVLMAKTPLGYRNITNPDGKEVIATDPAVAPIITKIFEWHGRGGISLKFTDLLGRLKFDDEVLEWVRDALHASHADERREQEEAIKRHQAEYRRLQDRINAMYVDKLDGVVDTAFFEKLSNQWRAEQTRCQREIDRRQNADKSCMEEGVQLLELARNAQRLFERQEPRQKRRLLNFVRSNCSWDAGEVAATFRQPFDLLAETTTTASGQARNTAIPAKSEFWLGREDVDLPSPARTQGSERFTRIATVIFLSNTQVRHPAIAPSLQICG